MKRRWCELILTVTLLATPALAEPQGPRWISKPDPESLSYAYPKIALLYGIAGYAAFTCTVTETGSLTACGVADEEPKGFGFGQAALSLSPIFRMQPLTRDGHSTAGGKITIPIRFASPPTPPVPKLPRADKTSIGLARQLSYLPALSEAIESDLRATADQTDGTAGATTSATSKVRLSSALRTAMQSKHGELLEALAIAHAAIMKRPELQAIVAAQTPVDLRSPEVVKRLQDVSDVVVPWYRATVFADARGILARSDRAPAG
jgi:TonB family protein